MANLIESTQAKAANTRGGKRPNSGRKPKHSSGRKIETSAVLTRDVAEFLRSTPNQSESIDAAVREWTPFRQWLVMARIERTRRKLDGEPVGG
jgi:hypothetical protein